MENTKQRIFLILIILLSIVLHFVNLHKEEFGNQYYSAAVKNMQKNFLNFFYVSIDSEGTAAVDKPPAGLWIQSLFAFIFGFSGFIVHIPQALAGSFCVFLLYIIVKKSFGINAGLLSALILTLTPIFVAVNRTNNMDSLLLLAVLISSYFLLKGTKKKPILFFIISLVFIGIGFNIKMLQAYMVLPAIYITFFFIKDIPVPKKIAAYVIGSILLIALSLSWAIIVDTTPKNNRPYICNSENNSVLDLIFGANGIFRLTSKGVDIRDKINIPLPEHDPTNLLESGQPIPGIPEDVKISPEMKEWIISLTKRIIPYLNDPRLKKNPFAFEVGFPGLLRLFNFPLGPQISWFLLFSLVFVISLIRKPQKSDFSDKGLQILFWVLWIIPMILYFSVTSGLFHRYYVAILAPPIAALTGIGIVHLKKLYESDKKWKGYLLPTGIVITGIFESIILLRYGGPVILPGMIILLFTLILSGLMIFKKLKSNIVCTKVYAIILAGMLFFPMLWSITPLTMGVFSPLPFAGPELLIWGKIGKTGNPMESIMQGFMGEKKTYQKLIGFLNKNNNSTEKFFLSVPSVSFYGSAMMLYTDEPILLIGGFTGEDPVFSLHTIQKMIRDGEVRYFLLSRKPKGANRLIYEWLRKNGILIPVDEWSIYPTKDELYDLKNWQLSG